MAYVHASLAEQVRQMLTSDPRTSLSAISAKLRVERHTLEKVLRTTTGTCFRELQRELMLARACQILAVETSLSIKQVSFLLGYKSPQAFSRFVKNACGRSPGNLRLALVSLKSQPADVNT